MTDEHPNPDDVVQQAEAVVARADELDARLDEAPDFARLFEYSKRTRRLARMCIGLMVAVTALAVVVGFIVVKASHNETDIAQANAVAAAGAQATVQTCLAANESRAGQRELWAFIFTLTRDSQQVTDLKAVVDRIFAPRDCTLPVDTSAT